MTTPPPIYSTSSDNLNPRVANAPARMEYPEKARWRSAAMKAKALYPGPVGDLVSRELLTIEEFGWTLGAGASGLLLLKHIEEEHRRTLPPVPRITSKIP